MNIQTQHFELFADYFQFYLQDEAVKGDLSDSWNEEAVGRLLALAPGTIGVGTVRDVQVPVDVEFRDAPPNDDPGIWDQVNECSIEVQSGRIVIAGCTDYFPEANRLEVRPGTYRARIYYGDLDTLSQDGLAGNDHYRVVLWPSPPDDMKVLEQRQTQDR
jgi:hypothetical protein